MSCNDTDEKHEVENGRLDALLTKKVGVNLSNTSPFLTGLRWIQALSQTDTAVNGFFPYNQWFAVIYNISFFRVPFSHYTGRQQPTTSSIISSKIAVLNNFNIGKLFVVESNSIKSYSVSLASDPSQAFYHNVVVSITIPVGVTDSRKRWSWWTIMLPERWKAGCVFSVLYYFGRVKRQVQGLHFASPNSLRRFQKVSVDRCWTLRK